MSGPAIGSLAATFILLVVFIYDLWRGKPECVIAAIGMVVAFAFFVGTQMP